MAADVAIILSDWELRDKEQDIGATKCLGESSAVGQVGSCRTVDEFISDCLEGSKVDLFQILLLGNEVDMHFC